MSWSDYARMEQARTAPANGAADSSGPLKSNINSDRVATVVMILALALGLAI
jgi:hypothetical protein